MATISLTLPQAKSDDQPEQFLANEAIAIGELFYLDANSQANVADNTDSGKDEIEGVALTAADAGNYVVGLTIDGAILQVSNPLVVGDTYILSDNGDVQLATDLASTEFLSNFGTVDTTSSIVLQINNTGSQKA